MRREPHLWIGEQPDVAAKLVHDRAEPACAVLFGHEIPGARQLRVDAASVDVAHQQPASVEVADRPQIHEVAVHQIQFHRTAGALHHEDVALGFPAIKHARDVFPEPVEIAVVVERAVVSARLAVEHELRADAPTRLEQDRVHLRHGQQPARLGLHHLRPRDLAAAEERRTVVRHVLRLERRHAHALAAQPGAHRRGHPAFARAGGRAKDRESFHRATRRRKRTGIGPLKTRSPAAPSRRR